MLTALRHAGRRVRSAQELMGHLRRLGFAAMAIREAVRACEARGVVDDDAAARLWAETWAGHGYSAEAIRSRLARKGFDEAVVGRTADRLRLEAGDATRAQALAAHHRGIGRAKIARRLSARGFDADTVTQVLDDTFGPSSA